MTEIVAFMAGVALCALWIAVAWARELAAYEEAQVSEERLERYMVDPPLTSQRFRVVYGDDGKPSELRGLHDDGSVTVSPLRRAAR